MDFCDDHGVLPLPNPDNVAMCKALIVLNDGVGDLEDVIVFFGGACQFESNCQRFPKREIFHIVLIRDAVGFLSTLVIGEKANFSQHPLIGQFGVLTF